MDQQKAKHVAIIMDGNGRWAKSKFLPRTLGHKSGVEALRQVIKKSCEIELSYLSVFAFSSENWKRPKSEVDFLMDLFYDLLARELDVFVRQNIMLRVVGDVSRFSQKLRDKIEQAQEATRLNQGLCLTIAANYGGRWDIAQAARRCAKEIFLQDPDFFYSQLISAHAEQAFEQKWDSIFSDYLTLAHAPDPDILIRTGGDKRISNFFLWQLAYTELFFFDKKWPDFTADDLIFAVDAFERTERRFGGLGSHDT